MFRQPMTRLILLLMVLFLLLPGCRRQQPAPKPAPQIEEPVISLYLNETGQKKDMKIEEYLQGVVAAEMDTKWPVNALAAQAILARTYTMENIQEGRVKQLRG
jgi:stage II sporulation protein D